MRIHCPACNSSQILTKDVGKKAGDVIGTVGGDGARVLRRGRCDQLPIRRRSDGRFLPPLWISLISSCSEKTSVTYILIEPIPRHLQLASRNASISPPLTFMRLSA